MQKDSFLPDHQPVVQFSKLDQNNKAEFLEFLIKNNITFNNAQGKDNLVAKITLKTLKPSKAHNNNNKSVSNNQTKKLGKTTGSVYDTRTKKQPSYADKENDEHYQQTNRTVKPTQTSKSPLKGKTFTTPTNAKNNNFATSTSPFNKIKISEKVKQPKSHKKKLSSATMNDSTISVKSHRNNNNKQTGLVSNEKQGIKDTKMKEKTPERKLYGQTQVSPLKSLPLQALSHRESTNTPVKQQRSVSYKKESHQQLSNFKKSHKSTFNQQPVSKLAATTKPVSKSKDKIKDRSVPKIRDKPQPQSQLNNSKQNLIIKQRTLSMSSSNQQTLNYQHKNQSFEVQERIQLVNKYREYFSNFTTLNGGKNVNSIKQRPVCWPLNQVEKFLDEFYDDNFTKNTNQILNGSKKLNDSLSKGQLKTSHIVESLQKYFNKKFNRVQKAIQYNLINLLYSIAFYINESRESYSKEQQQQSYISLKLFESFLTQKYELQDYLFFLFCRNILKQDFKKCFMPTVSKSFINKKEIDKFLKQIVGQGNNEILEEYHRMIFKMIPTYEIDVNGFLKIIVKDYRLKREAAERAYRENLKNNKDLLRSMEFGGAIMGVGQDGLDANNEDDSSSLENTFNKILNLGHNNGDKCTLFDNQGHIIREDSMQELTFGQQTKEILRQVQLHQKDDLIGPNYLFWQSPYINKRNENAEKERFLNDEFNQLVTEKLCQKTVELIEILSLNGTNRFKPHRPEDKDEGQFSDGSNNDDSDTQIQQVEELLFSKALCMFFTVVEMNKVKWLKELHITHPTQEDIEKVEEIQLFFRKIKQFPTAKDIAEFCKLILTVSQITEELSKFFV